MSSAATETVKTATVMTDAPAQHGLKKHTDGGWGLVPVQTRSERFRSRDVADFPAVTGREAVWKLTPVARIAELISGDLDGSPYPIEAPDVDGIALSWVDRDDARIGTAGEPEERASANAFMSCVLSCRRCMPSPWRCQPPKAPGCWA